MEVEIASSVYQSDDLNPNNSGKKEYCLSRTDSARCVESRIVMVPNNKSGSILSKTGI